MIALAGIKIAAVSWSTLAPLANHLWQSTIFAGTAGLLTLLLRKNRAQTRYWLWLIASAKFLIPFSLLIGLGSHLGWSKPASITQPVFTVVMQEIGQPFSPSEPDVQAEPATSRPQTLPARALLILLTTAWACGSLAVLVAWCRRWRRLVLAMRPALPANTGRELEVLRRLEKVTGTKPIGLFSSDAALEPGIVGIVRPVLLLPAGISDRLTNPQLEAIMTHELCHVRRRDNMIAALHMVVEAVFWFHPLVWWLGSRLVDERERACDEEVLRMGSDPQVYAQGILKVCEFYLESPLVCVAGVTGSSLKKRIEDIMMHRIFHQLELKKKLLLAVAGTAAIALPVVFGVLQALAIPPLPLRSLPAKSQAQSQPLPSSLPPDLAAMFQNTAFTKDAVFTPTQFEDEQARRPKNPKMRQALLVLNGCLYIRNVELKGLITYAYGLPYFHISGTPEWANTQGYDLSLKLADTPAKAPGREAVQKLLEEQFKLVVHREIKDAAVYDLVVADGGLKLTGEHSKGVNWMPNAMFTPPGHLTATEGDMAVLAGHLNRITQRVVVDKTGLQGAYSFTLDWTSDANHPDYDAVVAALKDQLGLDLKPATVPQEMLVVDHVERVGGDN